jgi:ParB family chromosome partitioning protein
MKLTTVKLGELHEAQWNANRVSKATLEKIRTSIERYGVVENLVVRPRTEGGYEVLSGNHRLGIYREMKRPSAPCYVIELDDAHARLLAQTLNRTRGEDDPDAYADLLRDVLAQLPAEDVVAVLPETGETLAKVLGELVDGSGHGDGDENGAFTSQYGVIVVCDSEAAQQDVYEALTADGYECRVVVT